MQSAKQFHDGRLCTCVSQPARLVIGKGLNKGYRTTRGSKECTTSLCEICGDRYLKASSQQRWCKACVPDARWRHLIRRYGMGKRDWDNMLAKQNGACAICPSPPKVVDHRHSDGVVRGLLCHACNRLVSSFDASADWIDRARRYARAL